MRVYGSAIVRNEADLIEAFVRHNLTCVDGLVVVDHLSQDGTHEILQALVAEGLPLFVARETAPVRDEYLFTNRLVRHVFATSDADWVFPLDADEFLKVPSRASLEATLAPHAAGPGIAMAWQTYVPLSFADGILATISGTRRVREDRHGLHKVAVSRRFAAAPELSLGKGHHQFLRGSASQLSPIPSVMVPAPSLAIAHVPVRSARQFTAKMAIGWLASLNDPTRKDGEAFHWREAFDYLRSGRPLSPLQLQVFAANYSVPMERWLPIDAIEMVDEPFLAAFDLHHAHRGISDPLALVLACAEGLIRR